MKPILQAVAEASSTREEVNTSEHFFEFDFRASSFGRVQITINLAEMAKRIEQERVELARRGRETPTAAWMRHLNAVILRELDRQGTAQLLHGGPWYNDAYAAAAAFLGILDGFGANATDLLFGPRAWWHPHLINSPHDLLLAVGSTLLRELGLYLNYLAHLSTHERGDPIHWSLLGPHAPELDRAVVLKLLCLWHARHSPLLAI